MAREPQYGVTLNGWERLLLSLEAKKNEFPQLEMYRTLLATMLQRVREISAEQAALTASKQDATQRLQKEIAEGRKVATLLRTALRQHYGNRSEKLVEFDLQPLRARTRKETEGAKPTPATPSTNTTP